MDQPINKVTEIQRQLTLEERHIVANVFQDALRATFMEFRKSKNEDPESLEHEMIYFVVKNKDYSFEISGYETQLFKKVLWHEEGSKKKYIEAYLKDRAAYDDQGNHKLDESGLYDLKDEPNSGVYRQQLRAYARDRDIRRTFDAVNEGYLRLVAPQFCMDFDSVWGKAMDAVELHRANQNQGQQQAQDWVTRSEHDAGDKKSPGQMR